MVDISGFMGPGLPISATPPAAKPAPPAAPVQPSTAPIAATPKNLTDKIVALADKDGMKPDDPLRLMHVEFAKTLDEFRPLLASYGPDTGQRAAEAAATVMRQEGNRLVSRMRWRALAMLALGGSLLAGAGLWGGWTLRGAVSTEVKGAAIPRDMADRFPYQNWQAQWDNRQQLLAKDGFQWSMVPFLEGLPKPPRR